MRSSEKVELMNLCMIYDDQNRVVMQMRKNKSWAGAAFPGGHVEPGEAFVPSVIREVKEETGLDIFNVQLCGIKEWFEGDVRAVVLFFKTNCFRGELRSSEEGEVFWVRLDQLGDLELAQDFERNLQIFMSDACSELFYPPNNHELLEY